MTYYGTTTLPGAHYYPVKHTDNFRDAEATQLLPVGKMPPGMGEVPTS